MERQVMKKTLLAFREMLSKRCSRVTAAVLVLLLVFALIPPGANAGIGDIVSILISIYGTLRGGIGGPLNTILSVNTSIRDLHQQVVWPVASLNQARGFVSQVTGQYRNAMWQIHTLPTDSATLINPSQLEAVLRSGQTSGIAQIQAAYQRLYQRLPGANDAPAADRNMLDMDDAFAQEAIKTSVVSDQSGNQMLSFADTLEQQAGQAAPGSTPLLTAQAQIANLESQAFLQKMLATELREEAARLAHDNAVRKRNAGATRNLRDQVHQVLSRP